MGNSTIPNPPARYTPEWAAEMKRRVDELSRMAFRRDRDVELGDGRVVARSPNGTRFIIRVDDDGNVLTTNADTGAPAPTPSPAPTPAPSPASAPVNSVPISSQLVVVGGTIVFNAANGNQISVTDAEGGTLTCTVSVSAGTLTVITTGGATVTGNGGDSVTIVGTETEVNTALDGMEYAAPATAQTVIVQVTTSDTSAPLPLADNDQINVAVVTAPPPPATSPFVPFGSRMDLVNNKYPNGIVVSHKTAAQMDASIVTKYNAWRANMIVDDPATPGGKAVNFHYPNSGLFLTVSEGMAYGMLLAVLLQDQQLFDELFRTVRNHPAYSVTALAGANVGNYLMDWKLWADGGPTNVSQGGLIAGEGWSAHDADFDIVMALLMADRQFGSNSTIWDYLGEARLTLNALKVWAFKADGTTKGNNGVSRTSDYMPGHWREFAAASLNSADQELFGVTALQRAAFLIELMQNRFSSVGALMPDFIVNTNNELAGQTNPDTGLPFNGPEPSPGGYGDFNDNEDKYYANAQRNPWRWGSDLVYTNDTRWRAIQEKLTNWIKQKTGNNPANVEIGYHLDGTGMGQAWPPRGMVAGFMVGAQCNVQHQDWVNACWDWIEDNWVLQYYDSELMLLAMIVASGNWWNRVTGKASNAPGPAPTPAPSPSPTPAPSPSDGMPSKVVGLYFEAYDSSLNFRDVTQDANVLYLFNARPNGDGTWYWEWPGWPSASDVQTVRARGTKVMLTLGGAGFFFKFNDRTTTQNTLASVKQFYTQFGGFDGIDFNNFEGEENGVRRAALQDPNEMIWLVNELRAWTGNPNFCCTGAPAPNYPEDRQLMAALANAGVLAYAAPQYYDWVGFNEPGYITTRNRDWVAAVGASRVVLGLTANYPAPGQPGVGPSLSDCTREWDSIEAEFPDQRGVFAFSAQHNHRGGNVWSSTMRARVIG